MNDHERLMRVLGEIRHDLFPTTLRASEADDLRVVHLALLQVLRRRDGPTVKELAALIGRSESRTSRLVDQLVRRALVERREDTDDRRVRRVRISHDGHAVLRRIDAVRAEAQLKLLDHLDDDERAAVLHAMDLFAKAARRYRDERDRPGRDRRRHDRDGGR
ncbi:MarR family transcriptional regulator [Nocardiopsis sp. EMB25]|uniref:MarR family transcriptional regulator n=1 Tax=Nocardiopsis sp. EMB25 TaxID=2835867 RepID=UPI002284DD91|nr:helix-turn-helix domain-containing protein [Nocardiopsis sp. EMB25]MCY9784075.1 MarR family transcriptional regulator [Nocardiopsis sp. EMB25]